jgi:Restriction endonuclease NotI
MNSPIIELFTIPTQDDSVEWQSVVTDQQCAYLKRSCVKVRKSQPEIAIGTSSVQQSLKQTTADHHLPTSLSGTRTNISGLSASAAVT